MTWCFLIDYNDHSSKFFGGVQYAHIYGDILELNKKDGSTEIIQLKDIQHFDVELEEQVEPEEA